MAQPSGGPYGPVKQKYELPKDAGKIYYVSPDANAQQSGESLDKPTTLASAIERVVTGDAIIMRGGTYRTGNLKLNQGITIQPYADEQPVLKGTNVADKWERLENGLWKTSWPTLFPSKPADWWQPDRNKGTPLHRFNNDMVFVDGRFLQSTGTQADVNADSYFIDYNDKTVYISTDPTNHLVEITAFDSALTLAKDSCHGKASDKKGPTVRGIVFTQYAYRAIEIEGTEPEGLSDESKYGKDVVGSTFENCTISFCSRVAGYLRGDHLTIRHCLVSDTSTEGIYIISSSDVLLEKNIFRRNNIENITGYFPAAVKIFNQCYRVTCRDNYVTDLANSNGIWYDVGNVDGRFIDNLSRAWAISRIRSTPSGSGPATTDSSSKYRRERFVPATSLSIATTAYSYSIAATFKFTTIHLSTASPVSGARTELPPATASAGIPAQAPTSMHAKGTSLSIICSQETKNSADRYLAFSQMPSQCEQLDKSAGKKTRLQCLRQAC